ncbi:lipopolysaccharide kinase InaA family protein [Mangrovimonas sp. AS39]|uniref:lipopolysaccharide kinase InaA family protein n=1 Tax=Mangrovimonas TaxID=1211036 RepID=UPI0014209A36|nr:MULTISPECIES: lipopolysaccharide kinase InaA family protein [Mangrovimonas]MCF1192155.1 lipopolysaccharide kinase InaA family protein [Mangrovimonas futianensis]MCF1195849.1 lipopolysaccharide kinase InaA family protein [Mangrovimonas futianensis]NIK92691.1 lipopolysaccharide kinase [Mangrovimonas sp. CR14]
MSDSKRHVVVHPDYKEFESEILDCIESFKKEGDLVLDGGRNIIKSFSLGSEIINIKSFKKPQFFQAFVYKYLRESKAKRSFEYARKLINLGISTPFPIAYVEDFSSIGLDSSFYVSKHIDYDFDFRDLIHQPRFPDRQNILEQFTEFTFQLHENGINFLDHSPGNTLILNQGQGTYQFFLIDLNRMVFEPMGFEKRMHNFRRLWLSKTMVDIMSKKYAKLCNRPESEVYDAMFKHSRAFQKKINSKKLRRSGRKMNFKK